MSKKKKKKKLVRDVCYIRISLLCCCKKLVLMNIYILHLQGKDKLKLRQLPPYRDLCTNDYIKLASQAKLKTYQIKCISRKPQSGKLPKNHYKTQKSHTQNEILEYTLLHIYGDFEQTLDQCTKNSHIKPRFLLQLKLKHKYGVQLNDNCKHQIKLATLK